MKVQTLENNKKKLKIGAPIWIIEQLSSKICLSIIKGYSEITIKNEKIPIVVLKLLEGSKGEVSRVYSDCFISKEDAELFKKLEDKNF